MVDLSRFTHQYSEKMGCLVRLWPSSYSLKWSEREVKNQSFSHTKVAKDQRRQLGPFSRALSTDFENTQSLTSKDDTP